MVLLLAMLMATATATAAIAGGPAHTIRVPTPENPTPTPPEPIPVPPPSGPCANPELRCPDLVMREPSELRVFRGRSGRLRLGSRNRLVNVGTGPLSLVGERNGDRTMRVSQRIFDANDAYTDHPLAGTFFDFWLIPGQGRFWKLRDALHFELWTAGTPIDRFVKVGRKTRFCMRDLNDVPGLAGPRFRRFPVCDQSPRAKTTSMGLSVGWQESYPAGYHEQYVDVTGLRGCFSLRHVADHLQHVFESDESNNTSQTRVRLPPRGGRVSGC